MLTHAARLKSPVCERSAVWGMDTLPALLKASAPPETPPAGLQVPLVTLPAWPATASEAVVPVLSSNFHQAMRPLIPSEGGLMAPQGAMYLMTSLGTWALLVPSAVAKVSLLTSFVGRSSRP